MLSTHVLLLNRSFFPVHVTTVRRAFLMLYQDIAHVVDGEYQTFDFIKWLEQEIRDSHDRIGLVDRQIRVPRVLQLKMFDKIPRRQVRFNRNNIFLRDRFSCQYCGRNHHKHQLSLDHVIPRSRGGKTTWDNVVACCYGCNRAKGGHLPDEAGMNLIKKPRRPNWMPAMEILRQNIRYAEWEPFLTYLNT